MPSRITPRGRLGPGGESLGGGERGGGEGDEEEERESFCGEVSLHLARCVALHSSCRRRGLSPGSSAAPHEGGPREEMLRMRLLSPKGVVCVRACAHALWTLLSSALLLNQQFNCLPAAAAARGKTDGDASPRDNYLARDLGGR
ncbi:unnamed protein product [Lampetra fluviatilis]